MRDEHLALQDLIVRPRPANGATDSMLSELFGFIWLMGRRHQALVAGLSVALFVIGAAPLELQRRIVNEATEQASYRSLLFLVSLYLAVAVLKGAINSPPTSKEAGWAKKARFGSGRAFCIGPRRRHRNPRSRGLSCRSSLRKRNRWAVSLGPASPSRYSRSASLSPWAVI
ncbi:hypothetical protein AMJ96_PB00050 (plasmid) [Rhizobium sp. N113]|uniref:Hypothetical conserved protein n=1 Tax=Rhizobium etli (strain CIAT 652) TaxID=491916 RepID=B3Q260_RHIE6|nr:hypothetical conserved protein [Rhizobium etli CIAT 652]ANL24374.1 hypothetical protein AMJ96_PB00050 [Rhizobium sp. N113]